MEQKFNYLTEITIIWFDKNRPPPAHYTNVEAGWKQHHDLDFATLPELSRIAGLGSRSVSFFFFFLLFSVVFLTPYELAN